MQNNQFIYPQQQKYTILGSRYGMSNGLNSVNNGSITMDMIITDTINIQLQKDVQQNIYTPSNVLSYKKYIAKISGTITYDITESINGEIIFSVNNTSQILKVNEHTNSIPFCYYFIIDPALSTTFTAECNLNVSMTAEITLEPF